jgi:predicted metal-binding membrane protein
MFVKPDIGVHGALWLGFFGAILAAWVALFAMIYASPLSGVPVGMWQALCTSAADASFFELFIMWALMSAAMMLPTFAPALRTFLDLGASGAAKPIEALALLLGYMVIWGAGAALGAWLQRTLASFGWLGPDGSSLSLWLTTGLLLAAGLYQFTALKAACLAKCRMPLIYFLERWAPGMPRALWMGLELGVICFGCCWALMALAFVGGTMSLVWMGAATLFMVLEKLPEIGKPLTRPAGYALLCAAGVAGAVAVFGL